VGGAVKTRQKTFDEMVALSTQVGYSFTNSQMKGKNKWQSITE
jgi:hypothetical protein